MDNKKQKAANPGSYFQEYRAKLAKGLDGVNPENLDQACLALEHAIQTQAQVFVAGNGGSAAIANHLCCDWTKGTFFPGQKTLLTHSLSANTSLLTAIANDLGYDESYSKQVEMLGKKGDVLILISSSGKSPNIIKAAKVAQNHGLTVVGLTGFDGGELAEISNISVHVPIHNYGLVEDSHQIIMHTLAQFLFEKRS